MASPDAGRFPHSSTLARGASAAGSASTSSREATPVSTASSSASASASSRAQPMSASTSVDAGEGDAVMVGIVEAAAAGAMGAAAPGADAAGSTPRTVMGAAAGGASGDMDQFIRRMEMEKLTMQKLIQLQQRLELASVKANNGWSDMSIGEIEQQLPPSPRRQISPTSPRFDPPSPSRAAYHDRSRSPYARPNAAASGSGSSGGAAGLGYGDASPSSPRRRRMDDHLDLPPAFAAQQQHRRASSSAASGAGHYAPGHGFAHFDAAHAHIGSPLRPREAKKRSQSHSHRDRPTTQDVDAAKALTAMLGGGALGHGAHAARGHLSHGYPSPVSASQPVASSSRPHHAPPLRAAASLDSAAPDPGAASMDGRGEDDKAAVELMMFLAHSPSPATKRAPDAPARRPGTAARVLFADSSPPPSSNSTSLPVQENVMR